MCLKHCDIQSTCIYLGTYFTIERQTRGKHGRNFDSKVVLITGAGSGIGQATSIKMASLGAILCLSDVNETSLKETKDMCPKPTRGEHFTSAFDVGRTESCNGFIEAIMSNFDRVDQVFNCAGINPTAYSLENISDSYWDKLISCNLKGLFNVTRACIPHMKSGSSFVNVSSRLGSCPKPQMAVYAATKYGIIGFSKCMALDLGPKGIRINVIAPGYIDTPTNACVVEGPELIGRAVQGIALGSMGTAEECADVVALLFSDQGRYVNGSVVEITGGTE